jgi:leucyl-tRNA synthetase
MSYGTGAIMAVPGHDHRDWEFARAFGLPIIEVVAGGDVEREPYVDIDKGVIVNSGFINGMSVDRAKTAVVNWLAERELGESKVNYKLRDWVFSRQRYWGEPIPLVYCDACGWVALPYDQLPLTLPPVAEYETGEDGSSPLARMIDWVNTCCPACGGPARRESDTMPQWAGSSWYFLRYCDPHNDGSFASWEALKYWMPVDWYNGGMEHTTLHLLYSRFWQRFLYDIGETPVKEPYAKRTSHGMILGANGEKMSKSRGNVINPDDVVAELGADAFRLYEMFMGAFDQAIPWSTEGAHGCRRFLDRVWRLMDMLSGEGGISESMAYDVHFCIKKVTEDYERMKYNTAIAAMMSLTNAFYAKGEVARGELRALLQLLNPVAPHITEEINQLCGLGGALIRSPWPKWDELALAREMVEIAIQINGKLRGQLEAPSGLTAETAPDFLKEQAIYQKLVGEAPVRKLIFVPGRLVNIVL